MTMEQWTPGGYREFYRDWCGTGVATFELPARQSILLNLREAPPGLIRVSMYYDSGRSRRDSRILYGRFGSVP